MKVWWKWGIDIISSTFPSDNYKNKKGNDYFLMERPSRSLEKATTPHSSTLAWKIPWKVEPGRLQSMGSQRVGHDWLTSLSLFPFTHWRRKWWPTPVFLPRESQGRWSLVGFRLWGRRVGHDWSDLAAAAADLTWVKKVNLPAMNYINNLSFLIRYTKDKTSLLWYTSPNI